MLWIWRVSRRHLGLGEVHLGVLSHEFLWLYVSKATLACHGIGVSVVHTKHLLLLLLIRARKTHLLLLLVVHHLFDHGSGVAVQVTEFAVFGSNFGRVDLGSVLDDMGPPFHLVDFVEMDGEFLA